MILNLNPFSYDDAKIAWACRRGMLELDVLFSNFYKNTYPTLTASQQSNFKSLLLQEDQHLFSWLFVEDCDVPLEFESIIKCLKKNGKITI